MILILPVLFFYASLLLSIAWGVRSKFCAAYVDSVFLPQPPFLAMPTSFKILHCSLNTHG